MAATTMAASGQVEPDMMIFIRTHTTAGKLSVDHAIADEAAESAELACPQFKPMPGWLLRTSLVCAWGFSNILLLLSNRYLLTHAQFQQPVFLTFCHMLMSCMVPLALSAAHVAPSAALNLQQKLRIAALAAVFSASVIAGNLSLRLVPISFFQAIGATTPAFVAVIALLLLGQREDRRVYMALIPVMLGLGIATGAEPSFNATGFALTIAATALRALKTIMQGLLLNDTEPLAILRHMAFFASGFLLLAMMALEGNVLQHLPPLSATLFWTTLLLNCSLALASNFLNIMVTKATSALSLQVFGNAFGVLATAVSIIVFCNPVTAIGMVGYGVTTVGVVMYIYVKQSALADPRQPKMSRAKTRWALSEAGAGDADAAKL